MYHRHATAPTAIGELTLVAADAALIGIYFPQHWVKPERAALGDLVELERDPLLAEAARQLEEYLVGQRTEFDLPTAAHGDAFQERVWALLRQIPFGETVTYGELAERLGDKSLARMVGRAVGHNPLSIIVPCHRVVGKNNKLTGYAGGLERKQFLLDLEAPAEVKAAQLF
ncbi:methylated-DNA--[protein]-cysteine S-methyltransferase [Parafrigoribacterium mesophilum]|uniref:methylated-DNA--[protein]-cysteine S-methyltransferase n=1 Tax=Parafrigoribacterium mesophilum TaxID=433646 RepID=UPI0031FC25AA